MAVEEHKKNDEAAIQGLLDDCTRSLRDKNIEGVMSLYAQEVVSFDIVPPLRYVGADPSGNPLAGPLRYSGGSPTHHASRAPEPRVRTAVL